MQEIHGDLWLLFELLVAIIYFKTAETSPSPVSPVSISTISLLERVSWEIEIGKLSRDAEFWDSNAAEIIRQSGGCDYGIRKNKKEKSEVLAHHDKIETQRRLIIAFLLFIHTCIDCGWELCCKWFASALKKIVTGCWLQLAILDVGCLCFGFGMTTLLLSRRRWRLAAGCWLQGTITDNLCWGWGFCSARLLLMIPIANIKYRSVTAGCCSFWLQSPTIDVRGLALLDCWYLVLLPIAFMLALTGGLLASISTN